MANAPGLCAFARQEWDIVSVVGCATSRWLTHSPALLGNCKTSSAIATAASVASRNPGRFLDVHGRYLFFLLCWAPLAQESATFLGNREQLPGS